MPYLFAVIIIFIQSVLTLTHWFLYKTLVRYLHLNSPGFLAILKYGILSLSFVFVLAALLAFKYYNLFSRIFYTLAAGWLGVFFFLLLAAIVTRSAALFFPLPKIFTQAIFLLAVVLAVYSFINASILRVRRIDVALPNLPASWQGKTAVWVSDTHLGQIRNLGFVKKVAGQISALHPDMIFIGGDLYDGVAVDADKVISPFASLKAPRGIYFITGNHEEFRDSAEYLNAVKRAGITILDNQMVNLNGLQIIGLDYNDSRIENQENELLKKINIDVSLPSILLKHEPNNLDVAEQAGISLQLSGHTHRAQVWPFSYIPRVVYKGYEYGLKTFGKMQIYTSDGAGTWGPPIRFLTMPEIVVIQLNSSKL